MYCYEPCFFGVYNVASRTGLDSLAGVSACLILSIVYGVLLCVREHHGQWCLRRGDGARSRCLGAIFFLTGFAERKHSAFLLGIGCITGKGVSGVHMRTLLVARQCFM